MKTLVLAACLIVVVHGNQEVVKAFHGNIAKCSQELNKPPNDVAVVYCTLRKGGTIDGENKYMLERGIANLDDLISDEPKRNQGKTMLRNCYQQARYGDPATNERETLKGIQCAMPVFALIDKA